jgi:HK97 family phage prohead protease
MPERVEILYGTIPYNSRSEDLMGFFETLAPGCFADSLSAGGGGGDVIARQEHDSRLLLGRRSAGTLRLIDGSDALRYEVDLPENTAGIDCGISAARGDLKNTSFCFYVEDPEEDEEWSVAEDGSLNRTVKRAQIIEVSPVAMPAYPASSVSV